MFFCFPELGIQNVKGFRFDKDTLIQFTLVGVLFTEWNVELHFHAV